MTKYEELTMEYDGEIFVQERAMLNEGLYCDGHAWINSALPSARKVAILAEEIGHHETSTGNILDQRSITNQQQELRARKWAYRKMIPLKGIIEAAKAGCQKPHEFADYLDIDEEFLVEGLRMYGILDDR